MIFKKKLSILILLTIIFIGGFFVANNVQALDVGMNEVDNTVDLGSEDPRETVGRIINIAMLFLGVIAVGIIIFAGFKWMTASGSEEKVNEAKKILKNGVIGLVIVLSSWGIASFILNQLMSATNPNPGGPGSTCIDGETVDCGCGGSKVCNNGSWGICVGSDCGPGSGESCDGNTLTPTCNPDNSICDENSYCSDECVCVETGGVGDNCDIDADSEEGVCSSPDDSMCGQYLTCDEDSCTCQGSPVISSVSPVGGFCEDDINIPCLEDSDCSGDTACDLETPNGAEGNLISVHGYNFSTTTELVFLGDINNENDDVVAVNPETVNSECSGVNNDNLIIAIVPNSAVSGPLQVTNLTDDSFDTTNNDVGPNIYNFVVNNIERPGICSLSPDEGTLTEQVSYQGIRLNNGDAYFGSYQQKSKGLNSNFIASSGTTLVPNLQAGDMTSFVTKDLSGIEIKSNYLDFTKSLEADTGPQIVSISPSIGAPGQYVTISGSGFEDVKGYNQVFFGNDEASYNFPSVCQSSVWTDSQVIVKVPDTISNGSYAINMKIGDWDINSNEANPNTFTVDDEADLRPSLCKMEPIRGPTNSPVTLYGEYFGDEGAQATVRFYYNQNKNNEIKAENDYLYIESLVPQDASTGPVEVRKNSLSGNSLDFTVAQCESDSDCDTQICCPNGTYKEGRCSDAGSGDNIYENCYVDIPSSLYKWDFSTGWGNSDDYYSCEGMAQDLGACQVDEFCPNSPGLCSPYEGGGETVIGVCDISCSSYPGCDDENVNCVYDSGMDKCVKEASSCSLSEDMTYDLGDETYFANKNCQEYNDNYYWHINVETSCPNNWTRLVDGVCVDENSSCSICEDEALNCVDDGSGGGVCVTNLVCDNDAVCVAGEDGGECVVDDSASCDCCCEVGEGERDCCAPLTCENDCGSDKTGNDTDTYGYCSGCAGAGSQEEMDAACNCVGISGKYCEVNGEYPEGICVDCAALSTEASCLSHGESCCYDGKNDMCRGIGDGDVIEDENSTYTGYCAYYDCNQNSETCNINAPSFDGEYTDSETCTDECSDGNGGGDEDYCTTLSEFECVSNDNCCLDAKEAGLEANNNDICRSGDDIGEGDDANYCAYYNCQEEPDSDLCNTVNPVKVGEYKNIDDCNTGCESDPGEDLGANCASEEAGVCDTFNCSDPFACLASDGSPASSSDCGFCCCDPNKTGEDPEQSDYDYCLDVDSSLSCEANQTPCDGSSRGLCCGCSSDSDCGSDYTGCGLDTCCRARPRIVAEDVSPAHNKSDVCRNVLIRVPFNERMDKTSFQNNFLLLAEHDYGETCPEGTFLVNKDLEVSKFAWWEKMKLKIAQKISPILIRLNLNKVNNALAQVINLPTEDDLYCLVPGSVTGENNSSDESTLLYSPNKLLDASTTYYGVVKGDPNLDSEGGVKSFYDIGMNGRGMVYTFYSFGFGGFSYPVYKEGETVYFNDVSYPNSYIWKFKTLADQGDDPGICEIDYTRTEPDSYLFQTNENSLEEKDDDSADSTYDAVADRDKEYQAKAFSSDGQRLARTSAYDWDWDWYIDDIDIVSFFNQENSNNLSVYNDSQLIKTNSNTQDGETFVKATVNMDAYSDNITLDGNGKAHSVPVHVFVCNNPWPAPDSVDHSWSPWVDVSENCTLEGEDCDNYNYKFYYCRDAGEEGTYDDLPAIIDDAIIRGSNMICSDGSGSCENDSDCGDGVECVWNVLKESYFFRESVSEIGTISSVEDKETGGTLQINWSSNSYLVDHYILYYRDNQSGSYESIEIDLSSSCSLEGDRYSCNYMLNDLEDNKTYYFKVSAITENNAESPLSNEVSGVPTDKVAPKTPLGLGAESY